MKKLGILLFAIVVVLSNYSCNNTFDPNATFRERYALNGIMRSDTTLQIVTLSKSYELGSNFNPLSNNQDPAVVGAQVNMWYRDTLYPMKDTTIARQDTSRYKDSVHCYYVNNLKPQADEYVDIEALLPSGILLQSSTKLPDANPVTFFDQNNDKSVPPSSYPEKDFVMVKWTALNNIIYSPKINIIYYLKGSSEKKEWPVPLYYITENGKSVGVYPQQTKLNYVKISMETIVQALNEIPHGNNNKSDYSISTFNVEVVTYDENLSTYYLSIQNGLDDFTVRLDRPDYSNIQGGYGIFGSYVRTDYAIRFSYNYLKSLGFE